jgi:hypothetical protein
MRFAGVVLDLPSDFSADEALISLRAPAVQKLVEPRALQKQTPIRPSLIIHRRRVGDVATLETLAGEVCAELASSVVGLKGLATEAFSFKDGASGILVGFDFPAAEVGTARQYHGLRKDGPMLTTITLTIDGLTLTEAAKKQWLSTIASVVVDAEGTLT